MLGAVKTLAKTGWSDVEALRERIKGRSGESVQEAAQLFVEDITRSFPSVVLGRLFLVLPFSLIPASERERVTQATQGDRRLVATTRVLSLLGTSGRQGEWRDRARSKGHLAIPLFDRAFVHEIPMLASLLSALQVDFAGLADGRPIASKLMLGGLNGKFLVTDAQTSTDELGRFIIPARDFVAAHRVRTVFGMGGSYVDGTLAVAVFFTDELLDPLVVDRFPTLISNFKMATSSLLAAGRIYPPPAPRG
jgi:hypothetical protein